MATAIDARGEVDGTGETGAPQGASAPAAPPRWHQTVGDAYRRHHDRLIGFFYRRTNDRPLAEDLAHDTMVRFAASADRFDASRPAWPYLKAAANNVLTDHLRRDARQVVVDTEEELYDEPGRGSDLDDTVVLRSLLDRAIRDLPERQRIAVELRCERGWSATEAAAFLGVAPGTFGQLLFRARRNLRAALDEAGARVSGVVLPALVWARLRTREASDRVREIVQSPATALSGEAIASVLVAASLSVTAVATSAPAAPDESAGSAPVMTLVRQAAATPVDASPPPALDLPDPPPPANVPAPSAEPETSADTTTPASEQTRTVVETPDTIPDSGGRVDVNDDEERLVVSSEVDAHTDAGSTELVGHDVYVGCNTVVIGEACDGKE